MSETPSIQTLIWKSLPEIPTYHYLYITKIIYYGANIFLEPTGDVHAYDLYETEDINFYVKTDKENAQVDFDATISLPSVVCSYTKNTPAFEYKITMTQGNLLLDYTRGVLAYSKMGEKDKAIPITMLFRETMIGFCTEEDYKKFKSVSEHGKMLTKINKLQTSIIKNERNQSETHQ